MLDPIIDRGPTHNTRAVSEFGAVREQYLYGWGWVYFAVCLQSGVETEHGTYRAAKAEAVQYGK